SLVDRYPDAGALAEDLDCFLNRRPLVHAVNPCRRERCTNWGVRHRLGLGVGAAFAAACLAFLAMGMVLERSRHRKQPLPPIQESPELINAVEMLNADKALESVEAFSGLAQEYLESSIPRVYRGLAYDAGNQYVDAERCFREATGMSNCIGEMVEW